jgi:putative serine protease XkdF
MAFEIAKTVDEQRLVFGWANIAVDRDGRQIEDLQGDLIDPQELETAAYDFVLKFADTGEMHKGAAVGKLVESFIVTPEKLAAMGLVEKAAGSLPKAGWWVGFQVAPESFAKVKDGTYKMFSIQGEGEREQV